MSRKTYYRIELELLSSLSIGATDSDITDHDMVLDSRGFPMIPGSALAGAYRELFYDHATRDDELAERTCNRIFGDLKTGESALRVYDATLLGTQAMVTIRDSVALRHKVAIPGLKFDRQIVERGARFVTYLETLHELDAATTAQVGCTQEEVEAIICALDDGRITIGAKTTRGMGRIRVTDCRKRSFVLPDDVDEWLRFDMFGDVQTDWPSERTTFALPSSGGSDRLVIDMVLRLRGGVSVREYTTEVDQADFSQLVVHSAANEEDSVPLIPGTSWAGAFRTRFKEIAGRMRLDSEVTDRLFGSVGKDEGGETVAQRSRLAFGESVVEGGEWITYTRNAIDRITASTIDAALFTERTYYGGTTRLVISLDRPSDFDAATLKPFVATLADLHYGFLAVGGMTSVGRGLFRIDGRLSSLSLPKHAVEESRQASERFFAGLLRTDDGGLARPDLDELAATLHGGDPE